jgi:2-dehydropantoate 2-reductase
LNRKDAKDARETDGVFVGQIGVADLNRTLLFAATGKRKFPKLRALCALSEAGVRTMCVKKISQKKSLFKSTDKTSGKDKIMSQIKKVCVFGLGGVGGYFGGKMADIIAKMKAPGHEIYFIARGTHLSAIKDNGIKVVSPDQTISGIPTIASDHIGDIPAPDLFFICVKSYDLKDAIEAIKPKINKHTIIIPLLNGADIYDRIRAVLTGAIVLPACVYVGTHIGRPGVIQQNGGDGKILIGNDPQFDDFSATPVKNYFEKVGLNFKWTHDPFPAIWEKYMFIAAYGLVTAYSGKTIGEVLIDAESKKLVRSIMMEIFSISKQKGIELPQDIVDRSIAKAGNFPFETKTSYQRDIEQKGSINEGDLYGGFITRQGRALGIATPTTQFVYSQILEKTGDR